MLLTLLVYHVLKKQPCIICRSSLHKKKNMVYVIRVGCVYDICYTMQSCKAKVIAFVGFSRQYKCTQITAEVLILQLLALFMVICVRLIISALSYTLLGSMCLQKRRTIIALIASSYYCEIQTSLYYCDSVVYILTHDIHYYLIYSHSCAVL